MFEKPWVNCLGKLAILLKNIYQKNMCQLVW